MGGSASSAQQIGSFSSSFQQQKKEKSVSLVSVLISVTLGVGAALLALNYYHASTCITNSPDEKEAYIRAVGKRLEHVERQISQNSALMDKLIGSLQAHSTHLDPQVYSAMFQTSQSEAIKIALEMVAYPAPSMPDSVKYKYDSSSSSSSSAGDKWATGSFTDDFALGKDTSGKAATGSYSSKFDDLYSTGGVSGGGGSSSSSSSSGGSAQQEKETQHWESLTDSQAIELCTEMQHKYSVVPGVSWGSLPFDLQQKWVHYSCDYHLSVK